MPTKCCWVIHGSLTSERKASSTSPSSFINHSTLLLNRALKRQAPCLFTCTSKFERSTGSESERVDELGLRAVEVIICMITRDFSVISMTSQASLSLSLYLSQKSLTHNIGSASALPIINLKQVSNFGGTFDQRFLWVFFWKFHRRCLSTSSIPWCKKVKNDQKLKSRGS